VALSEIAVILLGCWTFQSAGRSRCAQPRL